MGRDTARTAAAGLGREMELMPHPLHHTPPPCTHAFLFGGLHDLRTSAALYIFCAWWSVRCEDRALLITGFLGEQRSATSPADGRESEATTEYVCTATSAWSTSILQQRGHALSPPLSLLPSIFPSVPAATASLLLFLSTPLSLSPSPPSQQGYDGGGTVNIFYSQGGVYTI